MGAAKQIKMVMIDKDVKYDQIAEKVGKPPQSWYNYLSRDTMKYDEVVKIADVLGCDVVFRCRDTGKEY